MPSVSVIIATHSRPHLLPRAVESAQKAGTDVEVIVVDDASTDETAEVCRNLKGIKYVRAERNQRVAGARNLGILASTAEYISFLDDDDVRLPGTLDRQVEILKTDLYIGMCYGPVIVGDQDCNPTEKVEPAKLITGDIFWEILTWNPIFCLSAVFRKSCLYRIGLLNPHIAGFDDWDLWVRISELYQVAAIEEPIGIWRASTPFSGQGTSASSQHLTRTLKHQLTLLNLPRALSESPERRNQARFRRINLASDWLIWNAATLLSMGASRHALRNIRAALRINPIRATRIWTLKLLLTAFRQELFHRAARM